MSTSQINSCSIATGTYLAILWRIFLSRRWWVLAVPVVISLALIPLDVRFAFVALILAMAAIMIAIPLIYYYALTQESRWSILEKTIEITDDGLTLTFSSDKMQSHVITWSEIAFTTAASNCLVIRLKKNRYTFLGIPLTAFSDEQHLRTFVITLRNHINTHNHQITN